LIKKFSIIGFFDKAAKLQAWVVSFFYHIPVSLGRNRYLVASGHDIVDNRVLLLSFAAPRQGELARANQKKTEISIFLF
jgi:hypothetical protein